MIETTADEDPALGARLAKLLELAQNERGEPSSGESISRNEPDSRETDGDQPSSAPGDLVRYHAELGPGTRCGPFQIERKLARGGMGNVYLAKRVDDLDLKVALKALFTWNPNAAALFQKECKILSGLHHPNIAHLIDAGVMPSGQPWLAIEYVEGQTLSDYLKRVNPDLKARLHLFLKICDALSHAHQHMVIHRDLKPRNIMVMPDGDPKLLDFGIATTLNPETGEQFTVTANVDRMMTPEYASPEQIKGLRIGAASDVYSLGVLLYEMLTGRRPIHFETHNLVEIMRTMDETVVQRPSTTEIETSVLVRDFSSQLRGDLDNIVLKALAREPDQRYASVEALAADIRAYLLGLPVMARTATRMYRFRKFIRRNPWPVGLGTLLSMFLLLFSLYAQRQRTLLTKERDLANREKRTAEHVTDFIVSLFEQVDPDLSREGEINTFEIMENGRRQIDETLEHQPDVQVRLMTTMGKLYRVLGRHEVSQDLLERAVAKSNRDASDTYLTDLELVRTLQARGAYEEARERLDALGETERPGTDLDPGRNARLAHAYGKQWFLAGNYVRAKAHYAQAVDGLSALTIVERLRLRRDRAELESALGNYESAIDELRILLDLQKEHLGPEHSEVARTLASLGNQYQFKGQFEAAGSAYEQSERLTYQLFGDRHPNYIACLAQKGLLFEAMGDYASAEPPLRQALDLARDLLGEDHPQVAATLVHLGSLLHSNGTYPAAEDLYRQAMAIQISRLGEKHPEIVNVLNHLGLLFKTKGDYTGAENFYRRALAIAAETLGEKHMTYTTLSNNLAMVLQIKGDHAGAEALQRKGLAIRKEVLGEKHPLVSSTYNNLALLLKTQGKYAEAEPMYRKALELRRELYGDEHPKVAVSTFNLAVLHHVKGDFEAAEALYREAYLMFRKVVGTHHPYVAASMEGLGAILYTRGEYGETEDLFHEAGEIFRKALGEKHIRVIRNHIKIGNLYRRRGELDRSASHFHKAITLAESIFPKDHEEFIALRTGLACTSLLQGDRASAKPLLERALNIVERTGNIRDGSETRIQQARLLRLRGNHAEAEHQLREALTMRRDRFGANHHTLAPPLLDLAELTLETGNAEKALSHVREAIAIQNETLPAKHEFHRVAESIMGETLFRLGKKKEAEPLLRNAHRALADYLGDSHFLTRDAQKRLETALAGNE
ncbi:serine/threonine-protein kinase [Sulfidibacter corallicola]|uniref:Tetratricopeptide repeat protein n=1 Tax=Sulfidibacter corallicola TaxID=2818388 RepID=A0A8A4TG49_SULCO|nr:serine/threonine-protein kinase [Sulfidibacter corallicola]QTD49049.1 tetratricopeptide repeat protein [Sulfidibacter corallicola]